VVLSNKFFAVAVAVAVTGVVPADVAVVSPTAVVAAHKYGFSFSRR
jgi:hypothetical protein